MMIKNQIPFLLLFLLMITFFKNAAAETSNASNRQTNQLLTLIQINTINLNTGVVSQLFQNYDVIENKAYEIRLVVNDKELSKLKKAGHQIQIIRKGSPLKERLKTSDLKSLPTGYQSLEEMYAQMQEVATAYPDIAKLIDVTSAYDMPATFEGRHLYILKISDNVNQEEDEPDVLIVSNHHAREVVTPVIALHAIEQLTSNYGTEPEVTSLVNNHEIWIAPTWNPDGYNYMYHVDDMWRKNRRVGEYGIGVDQNRNYPFLWDSDHSGSTDMSSNIYKGPSAGSEPETQTMITFSEDQRFEKVMDFHSSGRQVLWGYYDPNHPFDAYLQSEALNLAMSTSYFGTDNIRRPSSNGEHYQWQLGKNGSQAFLIETHTEFSPSYESAQEEAVQVWQGIKWFLERKIPLSGHITDSITGEPLEASIGFKGIYFQNDEANFSDKRYGYYHQFCPPGTFTMRFSAEGYTNVEKEMTIFEDSALKYDLKLSPMITGIEELNSRNDLIKESVSFYPNFPNPCNGGTYLSYDLNSASDIRLEIYDTQGRLVSMLANEYQLPDYYKYYWNLKDQKGQKLSDGIYIGKLTIKNKNGSAQKHIKILVQSRK